MEKISLEIKRGSFYKYIFFKSYNCLKLNFDYFPFFIVDTHLK